MLERIDVDHSLIDRFAHQPLVPSGSGKAAAGAIPGREPGDLPARAKNRLADGVFRDRTTHRGALSAHRARPAIPVPGN
jgi:hypothetical protein